MSETLKEKTAKGLFWGGLSNGLQQVIGAVFGITINRILSPDDYGMVGMLAIFTAISNSIIDSGFTKALTNKKEIRHEDYNAVFWFNVFAGIALYCILFFASPLIARFYNKPELTNLARLLFVSFLFNGVGTAQNAIMFKKLMVKEKAKIDIAAITISGIVGITMALNGYSYWGIVIQTLTFSFVTVLLRWFYSSWRPSFSIRFSPLKGMFGFSMLLLITNIFTQISGNIFSVILGKNYHEEQVGYYTQGNKWAGLSLSVIYGMILSVAQPVFVETIHDRDRLLSVFRKMIRFGAFVSFPALLGLAFISKEFILVFLGEKWIPIVPFLQLICIWNAFYYIISLYSTLIVSYGRSKVYLLITVAVAVIQIICLIALIPFGIFPMLYAYLLCNFISLFIWHFYIDKMIGFKLWQLLLDIMPYLLISIGVFAVVWIITYNIANIYLLLISKILLSVLLYFAIMKYSNSIIFQDFIAFITKKRR